jgi:dinuclear metal center YbgI/SA1388 family protein
MQRTERLVEFLDEYLDTVGIGDDRRALNGLQVANGGAVTRVAAAVDASQEVVDEAARLGCDLLLVHHGLFWGGSAPVTGRRYAKLKKLLASDMAVYSSHLPLDVHETVGNSALLARQLGIELRGRFGDYHGVAVGWHGELQIRREALAARLDELLGARIRMLPGGPELIRTVGVITGGAGDLIPAAVAAGLDAYITGEGAHHTYFEAMEGGINVYYGGHYATETWGVRALAALLAQEFGLPWHFIDRPTGL